MGDLICSAPYYQNVRKHSTSAGEILCTGKGCIACNPKKNGDESIVRVLGDVDSVNFDAISDNHDGIKAMKTRERPETSPGCYRDNIIARRGGNKRKKIAKRIPPSGEKMPPKILVTKSSANYDENKCKKNTERTERSTFLTNKNVGKRNVSFKNVVQVQRNNPNHLAVPSRPKVIPLKQTKVKKAKNSNKKESDKSSEKIENEEKNFSRKKRHLYHTFPGARAHITSREKYRNINSHSPKTAANFLEMLKTSEVGIYDTKIMEVKSSIWIEKLLRQGVSEEELLPKIPQAFKKRKSGDGSERETIDKITQTPFIAKLTSSSLPRLSLNGKVEVRGGESVLIIEHEHDKRKEKDGVLHRLGFTLEDQKLKSSRNFPKFSIIEIADSLGEFVQMGAIKVIQRRNKRWLILVEGQAAKDFLLQGGVVLGGRHFELTEIRTF